MLVAQAVGRILDHLTTVELTLPPDQLPWRTGPVVRGLRLLPVRYEMARPPSQHRDGVPREPDRRTRGLLAGLRRLMFRGQG